jgi:hypothetical protein
MTRSLLARMGAVAAVLLTSAVAAQAQKAVYSEVFGLRPSPTSQAVVHYGTRKSAVLRVLGAPTKTTRFFFEINNAWATVLHYGPNKLYFLHDALEIAEVYDSRWTIGQAGTPGFRVGSALSYAGPSVSLPAKPVFGHFVVEDKPGTSRNLSYSAISYGGFKTPQGGEADEEGYQILFDKQGRVSHVFFGSY